MLLAQLEPQPDQPARARPQRAVNRGNLPKDLPRVETVVDLADKPCPCCRREMARIGEDRAERLGVVPAQLRVAVTIRPKYTCRSCDAAPVQAPAPGHIIEAGLPTDALVARVVVAKHADHCPLNRQVGIFASQGMDLDRATLSDWVGDDPPSVAYVDESDRTHRRPFAHLAAFSGILHCDGYEAYARIAENRPVRLALCWVHVR
jgi:transposase